MTRDLDITKVSGLVLIKITLTRKTKTMLFGKAIDALYAIALE
jgi:hypothetical protein